MEKLLNHDFILGPTDTDSISICKQDQSPFTEEEQQSLLDELNSIMPGYIKFENDGYFKTVIALRSKNYVLHDGKKITIKGSGLKATMKERSMREMIKRFIDSMLELTPETPLEIYHSYVQEIHNIKDISRWCSKKTITHSVLNAERSTEEKIMNALEGKDFSEGDKIFVYFKFSHESIEEKLLPSGKTSKTKKLNYILKLEEDYDNDHDVNKLLEKLYKNVLVFENVLDAKQFLNYSKVKNKKALATLLESK